MVDNRTIDLISKVIALFTSLLIFLGIISAVVYYRAFSINILENIAIGEALLLFLSKFSPMAISTVFGVLVSKFFLESSKARINVNDDRSKNIETLKATKWEKIFSYFVVVPLFILSFMGFSPFAVWVIPLSFSVRLFVLFWTTKRFRLILQNRNVDNRIVRYIETAGLTIIVMASIAMTEAYLVYTTKSGKEVIFYFENGEVAKTDSVTLYLGKSQSFYFLYDKKKEKAIILKADQIEKTEVQKLN